jgi:hypothetical protein
LSKKEKAVIRARKWFEDNRNRRYEYIKGWNTRNKDKISIYQKRYKEKLRKKVFGHYSGEKIVCACCGESVIEFLSLDHINGGGNKQRKEIGTRGGHQFYQWIVNNNYPPGFQVLCFNCNHAKHICGTCPHQVDL